MFGKKHCKFHEAEELFIRNVAYGVSYIDDLITSINHLLVDDNLSNTQRTAKDYIKNGVGATDLIVEEI